MSHLITSLPYRPVKFCSHDSTEAVKENKIANKSVALELLSTLPLTKPFPKKLQDMQPHFQVQVIFVLLKLEELQEPYVKSRILHDSSSTETKRLSFKETIKP